MRRYWAAAVFALAAVCCPPAMAQSYDFTYAKATLKQASVLLEDASLFNKTGTSGGGATTYLGDDTVGNYTQIIAVSPSYTSAAGGATVYGFDEDDDEDDEEEEE
jgi:hypothetical protein